MNEVPNMKPTPGPWIVTRTDEGDYCVDQSNGMGSFSKAICIVTTGAEESEELANAALISIAPDMLEALIAIQESAINAINGRIDANAVAAMISEIFEKLVNEAGV